MLGLSFPMRPEIEQTSEAGNGGHCPRVVPWSWVTRVPILLLLPDCSRDAGQVMQGPDWILCPHLLHGHSDIKYHVLYNNVTLTLLTISRAQFCGGK